MLRSLTVVMASIFFTGCVTNSETNDCFDFGTWNCVLFYEKLSDEQKASSPGKQLRSELCAHPDLRCVDEPADHAFPVKLKLAKEGYTDLTLTSGNGRVTGVFQKAGSDKKLQDAVAGTLATELHINDCDRGVLVSCEKIMNRISWGVSFDSFFQSVPPEVSARARDSICKNKDYKCLTFNHSKPYEVPAGWTVVQNSTGQSIVKGKRTERREVILKRS